MPRTLIVSALVAVVLAGPLSAQSTAKGRATIQIGEVMSLEVKQGGGVAVLAADGAHRELPEAVELEVLANRPWQLFVVAEGTGQSAGAAGAAAAESAIWWRADSRSVDAAVEPGYRRAEPHPVLVTAGAGGRAVIDVDYRWRDGPGRELVPGTVLHFTLAPR